MAVYLCYLCQSNKETKFCCIDKNYNLEGMICVKNWYWLIGGRENTLFNGIADTICS